jgi:hypothetical protein
MQRRHCRTSYFKIYEPRWIPATQKIKKDPVSKKSFDSQLVHNFSLSLIDNYMHWMIMLSTTMLLVGSARAFAPPRLVGLARQMAYSSTSLSMANPKGSSECVCRMYFSPFLA